MPVDLSVVVPILDEEDCLPELLRRLLPILEAQTARFEVLFVDDGSRDGSVALLRRAAETDARIKVLALSRNFGQHVALTAGCDHARGDVVLLMDGDGQDRPEEIPALLARLDEGYDAVYAVRAGRTDGWFKRASSVAFHAVLHVLVRRRHHASATVFRAMRRPVVEALKGLRERGRFLTGLVGWLGFRQAPVPVRHGARYHGKTKYSLFQMLRLAADALTSLSHWPLRAIAPLGLLALAGAVGAAILATSLHALVLACTGTVLVALGLVAEYVGRVHEQSLGRPLYVVRAFFDAQHAAETLDQRTERDE